MTKKPVKKAAAKPKPAAKKPADKQRNNSGKRGRPFPKGESGNPRGRPPMGETLTEVLKAVVEEKGGKEVVMEKLYDLALGKGRRQSYFPALKYLIDRWEGEPVKAIAAKLEGGDIPVVLLRSKQTVQDDDGE